MTKSTQRITSAYALLSYKLHAPLAKYPIRTFVVAFFLEGALKVL